MSSKWSKEEIEILKINYEKIGPSVCSELINRSIRSCKNKAKYFGIKFNRSLRYEKSNFIKIIKESKTKIECIRKLNLNTTPGNYDTLNKYIKLYNVDISHFENNTKILNEYINNFVKKDLVDVLVEHSTYNRVHLKKRLYDEGLKERICEKCGQDENWKGIKISLILDHINGINDDNRLENLRIVCPNCNAGLDTHCKGHHYKKSKYDKCICGKNKNKNSKHCNKCKGINNRKVERPPYDILLKEIDESNYCKVGRKYGVSDNAIRKWIKNYEKEM